VKEKVKGKGHLLASALFGGHRRNEPDSGHGPLFGSQGKGNMGDSTKPKILEILKNER